MIYFTSDFHFGHYNVLKLSNRPFKNIEEHDFQLIERFNSKVTNNDIAYILGDVVFRSKNYNADYYLSKLNGKKIILMGNHDKAIRQAYKKGLLNKLIINKRITIIGGEEAIFDKSLAISKMISINNQKIFLSHYPFRSWPCAFRDCWHLYGHTHSNIKPYYKSFDIGVDTNNYYPYSFEEIKNKIELISEKFEQK